MVTSIDSIPLRFVHDVGVPSAPARARRNFRLTPGRYRARASTRIPVEAELLVFDKDANLFLSTLGRSPSIEFQLDCERTVFVLGNVVGDRPVRSLQVSVDAVSRSQSEAIAA